MAEPHAAWEQVAASIARQLGLHYPPNRLADLRRGLSAAAVELEMAGASECAQALLADALDARQLALVASHLTVGETYFFRGRETFEVLSRQELPALIHKRRPQRRLRLWSAGCCTGEEPYSLAMVLADILPELADWDVRILGTDLNPRFIERARAGEYGEWSFRGVPRAQRERHFERTANGRYQLSAQIRGMVAFETRNLVAEAPLGDDAQDLILCRNVLMYFSAAQSVRAVAALRAALASDGWLVVAPCEASRALFGDFTTVSTGGAILYSRLAPDALHAAWPGLGNQAGAITAAPVARAPSPAARVTGSPTLPSSSRFVGAGANRSALPASASGASQLELSDPATAPAPARAPNAIAAPTVQCLAERARWLADRGRLDAALAACNEWIGADKLDAAAHHLCALVLLERGEAGEARAALQRAIYLQPERIMAHVTMGSLERGAGHEAGARRHYQTALELLAQHPPGVPIEQADGLAPDELAAAVHAVLEHRRSA